MAIDNDMIITLKSNSKANDLYIINYYLVLLVITYLNFEVILIVISYTYTDNHNANDYDIHTNPDTGTRTAY